MNEKTRNKNLASAKEKYTKWADISAKLHYVSVAFSVLLGLFYVLMGVVSLFSEPLLGLFMIFLGLVFGALPAWFGIFFAKKLKASISEVEKIGENQNEDELTKSSSSFIREIATYFRINGLLIVGTYVLIIVSFVLLVIVGLATGVSNIPTTNTSPYQDNYNSDSSYDYDRYDYDYNY